VATAGTKGGLEEKLEATELRASSATVLRDRDYSLTEGAVLDCVLETRMVSTAPGMTSCHLTRDVYSTSGRVVLLDRGSRLVGRYQGGMQQGDSRIFVLWTRAETPAGVVVKLDSPGTGPLGEAGAGGSVDTHFWDRFGAAILVSLIGSGADAVAARAAGPSRNTTVSLDPTSSAAKDVVARTYDRNVNMPPTLYVNQGERIGIFVARDLDFRRVYGLERVNVPEQ
jgi:type IV secretion system protein VirB10